MKPPPSIRVATPADLPVLLPLFRAYQAHYAQLANAGEAQTRAILAELLREPAQGFVLIAGVDGRDVGFATAYVTMSGLIAQRIAHLGDLFVEPGSRRNGIGRALFDAIAAEAARRKIERVRWLSPSADREANEWYRHMVAPMGTFELYLRPTAG